MLVISNEDMITAEREAVSRGLTFELLMERAGQAVAAVITQRFHKESKIIVICGPGNNGADGLIAAYTLIQNGWKVDVVLDTNIHRYVKLVDTKPLSTITGSEYLQQYDIIIDAIFGFGLNKAIEGLWARIVSDINLSKRVVISVDVPSGVSGNSGQVLGCAVQADISVVAHAHKIGHLIYPGRAYSGEVVICDIGLDDNLFSHNKKINSPHAWIKKLPRLTYNSNKYNRGHLCLIGGNMAGAIIIAAMAGQRVSAGIATIVVSEDIQAEYMNIPYSILKSEEIPVERNISALVIGPGLGMSSNSKRSMLKALELGYKCVIDADALNIFSQEKVEKFLKIIKPGTAVLTPHMGEFKRMFPDIDSSDKVAAAIIAARQTNAVIVLKGADTIVASPNGEVVININASFGLSTAGSGDALAGIIGSLLASGMEIFHAACAGVWIHGKTGKPYMVAEDIISGLPSVMYELDKIYTG